MASSADKKDVQRAKNAVSKGRHKATSSPSKVVKLENKIAKSRNNFIKGYESLNDLPSSTVKSRKNTSGKAVATGRAAQKMQRKLVKYTDKNLSLTKKYEAKLSKANKQGTVNKLKAQGMKSMSAVTMGYNRKGKK